MGAKRHRLKKKWPKYVTQSKGRIVWREYLGCVDGKPKFAKEIVLCKAPATDNDIWTYYLRVTNQAKDTLSWLLGAYHESAQFQLLATRTRVDYKGYRERIESKSVKGYGTFGNTPFSAIKKTTIRKYLDSYEAKNGKLAPVSANRHIQYLKSAYNWAMERYDTVRVNPCTGVKLNKEEARTRYVTDEEYTVAVTLAMKGGSKYLAAFMELAVLCRARRKEISAFTDADITEDGLVLNRIKGSEGEITTWTPRLRGAVAYARSLYPDAPTPIKTGRFLIHNKQGQPIKKNAFDSAWRRLMDKVEAAGGEPFTGHDLKAKGVTDHKTHAGVSDRMKKVYVRKLSKIEATE